MFCVSNSGMIRFHRHSTDHLWYKVISSTTAKVGKWHHVAVTWDQSLGGARMFIDATQVGFNTFNTSISWYPPRATYEIGDDGHSSEHQFVGSIMDLYIIDGALNTTELKTLKGMKQICDLYINSHHTQMFDHHCTWLQVLNT